MDKLVRVKAPVLVRLTAVRKLTVEAADKRLLAPALAARIARIKGVCAPGIRTGDWLFASPTRSSHAKLRTSARQSARRSRWRLGKLR